MKRARRSVAFLFSLAFLLTLFLVVPHQNAFGLDFDWTMPERFGMDVDSDGLIDYRTTIDSIRPPRGGWRVDFHACRVMGSSFQWSVDGIPYEFVENQNTGERCPRFIHKFPREGKYNVTLTETKADGAVESISHEVIVQDWLIVGIGDSFGSGQGNPDIPLQVTIDAFSALLNEERAFRETYEDAWRRYQELSNKRNHIINTLLPNYYTTAVNMANSCSCNFDHYFACIPLTGDWNTYCVPASNAFNDAQLTLFTALADFGITTLDSVGELLGDAVAIAEAEYRTEESAWNAANARLRGAEPKWQDRRCERSAISGQAKAALEIERNDPKTSVTFVHLACSGAKIEDLSDEEGGGGLLTPYWGSIPTEEEKKSENWIPPQMQQVKELVGDREVDALIVSIGGNDLKFAPIIMSCIFNQPCYDLNARPHIELPDWSQQFCAPYFSTIIYQECNKYFGADVGFPESAISMIERTKGLLPQKYENLDAAIGDTKIDRNRVYLTEYPNVVSDDDGTYCDFFEELVEDDESDMPPIFRLLPILTRDELIWAEDKVLGVLNTIGDNSAHNLGWKYVSGMISGSYKHGYCASDRYIVRMPESLSRQINEKGSVHPNEKGHELYREKIVQFLNSDFYTNGTPREPKMPPSCLNCHDSSPPNSPNEPPVADAGIDQTVEQTSADGALVVLDGSKSYDNDGDELTYLWTWEGNSSEEAIPTVTLPPGVTKVTLKVSDGKHFSTDTCNVFVVDKAPPLADIVVPGTNVAIQGVMNLKATATDLSGIASVQFFVRTPGGERGVPLSPVRYENLKATNESKTEWIFRVDTTLLQDGYYVILAKAIDTAGNEGWSSVLPFSIRNWAVVELLPSSERNQPGRTMPVKFTLRIDGSVDSEKPFVYNENLLINISSSGNILQSSQFGSSSRDYRINAEKELYITNFVTMPYPATFNVDIQKITNYEWKVGGFSFTTRK